MGNPILQQAMGQQTRPAQMPVNNPMQMVQKFNEFRQQMAGKDPKAMVQDLLSSGKMSQQQFNQLSQQANSLVSMFRR